MAGEQHGRGMGTAWARHGHGMGTAWARHAMCESALKLQDIAKQKGLCWEGTWQKGVKKEA
jgi:hypothetical protein